MVGRSVGIVCVVKSAVENVLSVPGSNDVVEIGEPGVATVVIIVDCSVDGSDGGFVLGAVVDSEVGSDDGCKVGSDGGTEGGSDGGADGDSEDTSMVEPVAELVVSVGAANNNILVKLYNIAKTNLAIFTYRRCTRWFCRSVDNCWSCILFTAGHQKIIS